jgi:G3E family GTPase
VTLPVTVLTGFLGSGKTTLLRRLLVDPAMGETAVLVNELGEIPLDHHLLSRVDERTVVLASGCVCCTVRADLADELRLLEARRHRGEIPSYARVVIETTGLADPAPILSTLLGDPMLAAHYRADAVVTTVDAANAAEQLDAQPESVRQVAVADRLVLTKADLVDADERAAVEARLRALNPAAPVLEARHGHLAAAALVDAGDVDPERRAADLRAWLDAGHAGGRHGDVQTLAVRVEEEVDWTAFGIWLAMLLQAHGPDVLRVKGLLRVRDAPGPVVLNVVGHVVHPLEHLASWPDEDDASRLVLIVRGLQREALQRSLDAFLVLGTPARR